MAQAKKAAEEYDQLYDSHEHFSAADLIVENRLLLNKVD